MKHIASTALVFSVALVLVLVLGAGDIARAEVKTLAVSKVSLDTPSGWKISEQGENYTMVGPRDEISFVVQIVDAPDTQKALGLADAYLNKVATDVKWAGKPKESQTNGMPSVANKARGKMAGKDASIAVLVVKTPAGKLLLLIAAVETVKEKDYTAVLKKFIDSIKPAA